MTVAPDEIGILELTVCYNSSSGFKAAKKRKSDKFAALSANLESRNLSVTFVTLEIGYLGHYTKDSIMCFHLYCQKRYYKSTNVTS